MIEAEQWLAKAVHNAPRPLPPGRFPAILNEAEKAGFEHGELMEIIDKWLGYGYCRILDPISNDIELTEKGERALY